MECLQFCPRLSHNLFVFSNIKKLSIAYYFQKCCERPIGRVRKNSGGKRQAWYQPQVTTGTHQAYRLLIAAYLCLSLLTSAFSLVVHLSRQTQRRQRRKSPAIYLYYLWLVLGLLFFHRYFSLPPYFGHTWEVMKRSWKRFVQSVWEPCKPLIPEHTKTGKLEIMGTQSRYAQCYMACEFTKIATSQTHDIFNQPGR